MSKGPYFTGWPFDLLLIHVGQSGHSRIPLEKASGGHVRAGFIVLSSTLQLLQFFRRKPPGNDGWLVYLYWIRDWPGKLQRLNGIFFSEYTEKEGNTHLLIARYVTCTISIIAPMIYGMGELILKEKPRKALETSLFSDQRGKIKWNTTD